MFDKVGEAEFLADADEQARAEVGERLVQNREGDLVGWETGTVGKARCRTACSLGTIFSRRMIPPAREWDLVAGFASRGASEPMAAEARSRQSPGASAVTVKIRSWVRRREA